MIPSVISDFLRMVQQYYAEFGRHDMLWRQPGPDGGFDPYVILVSELMLQQTQVARVAPKFTDFIARYPNVSSLAEARLGDVLRMWNGLGYNRRAKFLHSAAVTVMHDNGGVFPETSEELQKLPGVGPNTAGAIMAYAYDQPVVYLETNIRTVLIHHFYNDETAVPDKALREVLTEIIEALPGDEDSSFGPREFYWAMMDYGAYLKKTVGNASRASKSYARQSTFHGSRRQLRGQVIRLLTERDYELGELIRALADERAEGVVDDLLREEMLQRHGVTLSLH